MWPIGYRQRFFRGVERVSPASPGPPSLLWGDVKPRWFRGFRGSPARPRAGWRDRAASAVREGPGRDHKGLGIIEPRGALGIVQAAQVAQLPEDDLAASRSHALPLRQQGVADVALLLRSHLLPNPFPLQDGLALFAGEIVPHLQLAADLRLARGRQAPGSAGCCSENAAAAAGVISRNCAAHRGGRPSMRRSWGAAPPRGGPGGRRRPWTRSARTCPRTRRNTILRCASVTQPGRLP